MTINKMKRWSAGLALAASVAGACRSEARKPEPAEPTATTVRPIEETELDQFAANLEAALGPGSVGYGYAIYEGTNLVRSGAGGWARWGTDAQSPDWRFSVLSMSKTITAAAVMRRIEQMKAADPTISVDSPISDYLPEHWIPILRSRRSLFAIC